MRTKNATAVDVDWALRPDPANPNRMDAAAKAAMAKSLAEFGDLSGIIINRRTGLLVGGHQRTEVLNLLDLEAETPSEIQYLSEPEPDGTVARGYFSRNGRRYSVRVVDWPEDKAHAALLAANRYGRLGADDPQLLKDMLEELDAGQKTDDGQLLADLTGFDAKERERLALQVHQDGDADAEPQVDRAAELATKWGVKVGDLWLVGEHRLLCGDSTKAEDVARCLGYAKPLLMVTDPPYGVEYDADWRNHAFRSDGSPIAGRAIGKVTNDDRADWSPAWRLFPGDVAYVWHSGSRASEVEASLQCADLAVRWQIIWAKQQFVIGRGHYHPQHEPCWYCVRNGKDGHWAGDRKQTTLWQIDKPQKSETGHSTQKPVECMARPMRNHDAPEVYDPFLGSGTTMVAAQNLGRKCYGIEIAPGYCGVILQRMVTAFPTLDIHKVNNA